MYALKAYINWTHHLIGDDKMPSPFPNIARFYFAWAFPTPKGKCDTNNSTLPRLIAL